MTRNVEAIAAIVLLLVGLSQIYASRFWVTYYQLISSVGRRGVRLHGALTLIIGLIILRLHWVWSDAGAVLSLLGLLLVAEGFLCVAAPKLGAQSLQMVDESTKARTLVFTGVLAIVIAGVLAANLVFSQ